MSRVAVFIDYQNVDMGAWETSPHPVSELRTSADVLPTSRASRQLVEEPTPVRVRWLLATLPRAKCFTQDFTHGWPRPPGGP